VVDTHTGKFCKLFQTKEIEGGDNVKKLISIGVIIAILAIMLTPVLAGARIINDGGGPPILTSSYQHNNLFTTWGTAIITYTFDTCTDWTYQNFDKLSVRIQVWAAFTANRAQADAYVYRVHYYNILGYYFKGWDNVFHQYNVAPTNSYACYTWRKTISPYGPEYKLYSKLQVWDLLRWSEGPADDDDEVSYVTPARDPIMY
jgi:hypothetical protein